MHKLWFLLALTCFCLPARAQEISIPEVGFVLSLPAGWRYLGPSESKLHYVLEGPEGRIRAHLCASEAKTPQQALEMRIARGKQLDPRRSWDYFLLSSADFTTRSGVAGVEGAFGTEHSKRPSVMMHFMPSSVGRIVCFCVDHCKTGEAFAQLEEHLRDTLKPRHW